MKNLTLLLTLILLVLSSCARPVLTAEDVSTTNPLTLAKYVQQAVDRGDTASANTFYSELIERKMVREEHRRNMLNRKLVIGMTQYEVVTIAGYPISSNNIRKDTSQFGETTYWHLWRTNYDLAVFGNDKRLEYFTEK